MENKSNKQTIHKKIKWKGLQKFAEIQQATYRDHIYTVETNFLKSQGNKLTNLSVPICRYCCNLYIKRKIHHQEVKSLLQSLHKKENLFIHCPYHIPSS